MASFKSFFSEGDEALLSGSVESGGVSTDELAAVRELASRIVDLVGDASKAQQRQLCPGVLLRFARARQLNVDKAEAMFRTSMAWHLQNATDTAEERWAADHSEEAKLIRSYSPEGYHGVDRRGVPVFVAKWGVLDMAGLVRESGIEKFLLNGISQNEEIVRLMSAVSRERGELITTFVSLIDFSQMVWGRSFAALPTFAKAANVLDSNYPARLHACLVVKAPWVFSAIYKLASPALAEETRKKVRIFGEADSEAQRTALLEHATLDNLPTFIGGELEVDLGDGGDVPYIKAAQITKLNVSAGATEAVSVSAAGGTRVQWDFTLNVWFSTTIGFSVTRVTGVEGGEAESAIVAVPESQQSKHSGFVVCEGDEVVKLIFTNSSPVRPIEVNYKLTVGDDG